MFCVFFLVTQPKLKLQFDKNVFFLAQFSDTTWTGQCKLNGLGPIYFELCLSFVFLALRRALSLKLTHLSDPTFSDLLRLNFISKLKFSSVILKILKI